MLIPKVFLSKELTNDELYQVVKDSLGIGEIKEVKKDFNNVELMSEWSRFELRLEGKELSIHQRWHKEKMVIVVILVIAGLFVWLPFLFIIYKMYMERKTSKEIINKIGQKING